MTDDLKVQKLELKQGDILAVTYNGILSMEQQERLRAYVESCLPTGFSVPVLILDDGLSLAVISSPDVSNDIEDEIEATKRSISMGARRSEHRFRP
ncbi:hypothetical protein QBK99_11080 [Corticibacterium sp. UT-5YL-CI-8]|nr:hypothetical protein [Tianweitania sp. UT-5YL-CI-8]